MWKDWKMPNHAAKSTVKLRLWEVRELDAEIVEFAETYAASEYAPVVEALREAMNLVDSAVELMASQPATENPHDTRSTRQSGR